MLKMVDGTGIIGVDMVCPLGVSTPQPPNYDRVEMEGTGMLVLPNSLDAPLERLELGGKTEQVQTTGAQLFDKNSVVNGVIIADGSVTDNAPLYVTSDYIPVKPSVMYACTETGSKRLKFFDIDKQPVQKINYEDANVERGGTFTTGETTRFIRLSLLREKLDSIMLNEGSKSISYEPYTGGKPSPSLEYEQEVKNAGKWNEGTQKYEVDVKVTGKNLLNLQKEPDVKGIYQGWKCGNGEKITLSITDKNNNADISGCTLGLSKNGDSANGGVVWAIENGAIKSKELTLTHPYVSVIPANEITIKKLTERFEIQCEYGSIATDYQPYKEQTLTLDLDQPLRGIGEMKDELSERGILRRVKNIALNGSEKWYKYENSAFVAMNCYVLKIDDLKESHYTKTTLCNFFKWARFPQDIESQSAHGGYIYFTVPKETYPDLESFKGWLAKNTPVLEYWLKEPVLEELSEEDKASIRALKTYYPTTVITADGGELDPDIKVTYRKEI